MNIYLKRIFDGLEKWLAYQPAFLGFQPLAGTEGPFGPLSKNSALRLAWKGPLEPGVKIVRYGWHRRALWALE